MNISTFYGRRPAILFYVISNTLYNSINEAAELVVVPPEPSGQKIDNDK